MSKSKRKRQTIICRVMNEDELDPNFILNLKKGLLNELIRETTELIDLNQKGHSLLQRNSEENKDNYPTNTRLHFLLIRGLLIEMFVTLDKYLQQLILKHQLRILKIEPESLKYFDRAQKGIKEYFENSGLPPELDALRNRIKHFRILRNQFAHFEYGRFFFPANHESFESFLKTLQGISLGDSFHILIDEKAGVMLPYNIEGDAFIVDCQETIIDYYAQLCDLAFPTNDFSVFNYLREKHPLTPTKLPTQTPHPKRKPRPPASPKNI